MICPSCNEQNDPLALVCFACDFPLTGHSIRRGTVIGSRYEVRKWLGRGGMGTVYQAYDRVLEEDVAVKVLRPEVAGSADLTRRFRIEIKLARRVRHPNVCAIHEYGEDGDLRYISMELIEGTDLKKIVHKSGRLDRLEAFDIAIQVAEGLQAIHAIGVIHRDLKTANIMRDSRGLVRLMDFGIAKQFGVEQSSGATATGHILGTPEYMSPEQARGDALDPRTDIYALGIVIFEIFTGEVPFHADTPMATLFKHLQDPPPLHDPRLPQGLKRILERALAKETSDRYASAAELMADLVRARAEAPEMEEPVVRTEVDSIPALATENVRGRASTYVPPPTRTHTGVPIPVETPPRVTLTRPGPTVDRDPRTVSAPRAPLTPTPPPMGPRPGPPPRATAGRPPVARPPARPGWRRYGIAGAGIAALAVLGAIAMPQLTETGSRTAVQQTPASPPADTGESAVTSTVTVESRSGVRAAPSPPAAGQAASRPPQPELVPPNADQVRIPPVAAVKRAPAAPSPAERAASERRVNDRPALSPSTVGSPVPVLPWKPVPAESRAAVAAQSAPATASSAAEIPTGLLQVMARPWAEIAVDGNAVGTTPFRPLKLTVGSHTVLFSHPDYKPFRRQVTIRPNETTRLEVDLSWEAFKK